jgi:hypothetical protein
MDRATSVRAALTAPQQRCRLRNTRPVLAPGCARATSLACNLSVGLGTILVSRSASFGRSAQIRGASESRGRRRDHCFELRTFRPPQRQACH